MGLCVKERELDSRFFGAGETTAIRPRGKRELSTRYFTPLSSISGHLGTMSRTL